MTPASIAIAHHTHRIVGCTKTTPSMPRLPFPDPEPEPQPATPKRVESALSVTDLCGQLKRALGQAFPDKVRVVGEVSNFSGGRASAGPPGGTSGGGGGHWFFALKDEGATVRCVCFASVSARVRFPVRDGLEVIATGRIDMYPAQGSIQLYIDKLEPVGQGALELALREMVDQLRDLGYFDPQHKRPLPAVPRRVAVVTSRTAAALQDVINTAQKRWLGCKLLLYDVRVQGADAAPQIAAALRQLSAQGPALGIDAIILTRGGGSIEDLWAFNERSVADAIFDCQVPIVAAIGHETDTTVAELVADLRCATPTQAAMAVVPDRFALQHQIDQLHARLGLLTRQRVAQAQQRLNAAARHALLTRPMRLAEDARRRVEALAERIAALPGRRLAAATDRLDRLARHLDAIGPRQVLARGYTYTLAEDGRPIRAASQTSPGQRIVTVLHDGQLLSKIEKPSDTTQPVSDIASPETKTTPTPRPRPRRPTPRKDQGSAGLFDSM